MFHPRVLDLCEIPGNFALKKFVCDTAIGGLNQILAKNKEKASADYIIMVNMKCKGGKPATLSIKDEGGSGGFDMDPLKHKTRLQKDIDQQVKASNPQDEEDDGLHRGDDIDVDDAVPTTEPLLLEQYGRAAPKEDVKATKPVEG